MMQDAAFTILGGAVVYGHMCFVELDACEDTQHATFRKCTLMSITPTTDTIRVL